jgi:hypothetical protein
VTSKIEADPRPDREYRLRVYFTGLAKEHPSVFTKLAIKIATLEMKAQKVVKKSEVWFHEGLKIRGEWLEVKMPLRPSSLIYRCMVSL